MICDICKTNTANVFIKEIINGVLKKQSLCEACAAGASGSAVNFSQFQEDVFYSLSDMLAGFSDVNKVGDIEKIQPCPGCGMTFDDFQQKGRLGCGRCYDTFSEKLTPLMMRLQGSIQHAGKTPPWMEKQSELEKLKLEIQDAVGKEEYERAAVIRDRIKSLREGAGRTGGDGGGRD